MPFTISPVNQYTLVTSSGYSRPGRTGLRPADSRPGFGLAVSGTTRTEHLVAARKTSACILSLLSGRTSEFLQMLESFELPSSADVRSSRTVTVSDSGAVEARAGDGATETLYTLDIDRLATVRTMRSVVLAAGDSTGLAEGTHSFVLTVGDTEYPLSITVTASGPAPDTNRDVLEQLARAIGTAGSDVEASVTEGERKVYSTLSDNMYEDVVSLIIRPGDAGDTTGFSLCDSSGSVVDTLRLDRVVLSGKTARYTLNNSTATSATNTVSADGGRLTLTFLETGGGPVTIRVAGGTGPLHEQIAGLIAVYNDYMGWLDRYSPYIDPVIQRDIRHDVLLIERDLGSVGIYPDEDGRLQSGDLLEDVLETDMAALRSVLTGADGLFTRLSARLGAVLRAGADSYSRGDDLSARYGTLSLFA